MCVHGLRCPRKSPELVVFPIARVRVVVSYQTWGLGTELGSYVRAVWTLNHQVISSASLEGFFINSLYVNSLEILCRTLKMILFLNKSICLILILNLFNFPSVKSYLLSFCTARVGDPRGSCPCSPESYDIELEVDCFLKMYLFLKSYICIVRLLSCSRGWPGIYLVDQAVLELRKSSAH